MTGNGHSDDQCQRRAERQSARISKITNDGLTRSGTGCFIAVPIWQQWVSKGYLECFEFTRKSYSQTVAGLNKTS